MMNKLLVFLVSFLFVCEMYGQKDEIYRNESKTYSHAGPTYNVDVLIMKSDGTYKLTYQKFDSKKMKNKHIFYDLSTQKGTWEKRKDTLYLKDEDGKREKRFLVLNANKIAMFIEDVGLSPSKWAKVDY